MAIASRFSWINSVTDSRTSLPVLVTSENLISLPSVSFSDTVNVRVKPTDFVQDFVCLAQVVFVSSDVGVVKVARSGTYGCPLGVGGAMLDIGDDLSLVHAVSHGLTESLVLEPFQLLWWRRTG